MFERFTEKAIKVIMLAQEEARRLHRSCCKDIKGNGGNAKRCQSRS